MVIKNSLIKDLFLQAINFQEKGNLLKAKSIYKKIITINSKLPNAYYNLGNILNDLGEYEKAINCYEKVIIIDPQNISAFNNLGVLYKNAENFKKAIYYFENAIKINKQYFGAYINLGNILKDVGEYEKAINCYEKVIKTDPQNISAFNNLGVLYREIREYQKAIYYFNQVIDINPNLVVSYLNLGYAFLGLEDLINAKLYFKKAIQLNPNNVDTHYSFMEFLEKSNDVRGLNKAIITAKKFIKNNPIIIIFQTFLLFRKNRYLEAKSLLESINIEKYNNISFDLKIKYYELLAKTYDQINETKKSFKYFTKINKFDSNKKTNKKYDKEKILNEIDSNLKYFIPKNILKWKKINLQINADEFSPVFLVGFPRSGTTLLDSILRGHPLIEILEEKPMIEKMNFYFHNSLKGKQYNLRNITNVQIKKLRGIYFDIAKKYLLVDEKSNKIIIDKLPLNIKDIGFIHRIFPKSKFIFVLRHPCDSVLSCFMNRFGMNNAMINFYTLFDTANFYNKIMLLWKQYITVLPVHYSIIKYEDIIENLEKNVKPLISFIDLKWDKSLLKYTNTAKKRTFINTPSYNQVIKKIYKKSSGRWLRYEKEMVDVYPILMKWIKEFNY